MIKSMTGTGNAKNSNDEFCVSVQIQSVNNRFLDVVIRIPSFYREYEATIRQACRELLNRGKIDLNYDITDLRDDAVSMVLNRSVVDAYIKVAGDLTMHPDIEKKINAASVLSFPQSYTLEPTKMDDPEKFINLLLKTTVEAVEDLIGSRIREGKRIFSDVENRLDSIANELSKIEQRSKDVKKEYFDKIKERISELASQPEIDESRLEQEVAYLVDKSDITEEIVRFQSHIEQLAEIAQGNGSIGKKLEFLLQEMNREINTIGSKSKAIEISRSVIEIKSELEKIREQILNIE